jgi:hypothetical protein
MPRCMVAGTDSIGVWPRISAVWNGLSIRSIAVHGPVHANVMMARRSRGCDASCPAGHTLAGAGSKGRAWRVEAVPPRATEADVILRIPRLGHGRTSESDATPRSLQSECRRGTQNDIPPPWPAALRLRCLGHRCRRARFPAPWRADKNPGGYVVRD